MRVISGEFKGRRLLLKKGRDVRPTSSRVRTAIFNILPRDLSGVMALDLYAGTGALGIEALSRGATAVVFVDSGRDALKCLRDNLEALNRADQFRLLHKKAGPALKLLAAENARFDLALIDPPYRSGEAPKVMNQLSRLPLLNPGAVAVIEHDPAERLLDEYGGLVRYDQRKYGATGLSFYEWREEGGEDE